MLSTINIDYLVSYKKYFRQDYEYINAYTKVCAIGKTIQSKHKAERTYERSREQKYLINNYHIIIIIFIIFYFISFRPFTMINIYIIKGKKRNNGSEGI